MIRVFATQGEGAKASIPACTVGETMSLPLPTSLLDSRGRALVALSIVLAVSQFGIAAYVWIEAQRYTASTYFTTGGFGIFVAIATSGLAGSGLAVLLFAAVQYERYSRILVEGRSREARFLARRWIGGSIAWASLPWVFFYGGSVCGLLPLGVLLAASLLYLWAAVGGRRGRLSGRSR